MHAHDGSFPLLILEYVPGMRSKRRENAGLKMLFICFQIRVMCSKSETVRSQAI